MHVILWGRDFNDIGEEEEEETAAAEPTVGAERLSRPRRKVAASVMHFFFKQTSASSALSSFVILGLIRVVATAACQGIHGVGDEKLGVDDLVHRERNHKWGPFGITIRKGSRCWVARFPFHKKNSTTDCKKQSSALGEREGAARDALLR
eukprot:6489011-Amphidinium_carterae.1